MVIRTGTDRQKVVIAAGQVKNGRSGLTRKGLYTENICKINDIAHFKTNDQNILCYSVYLFYLV